MLLLLYYFTQSSDFKDHSGGKGVYEYNANGAMKKDTLKWISKIEYNSLNLPMSIAIDNGQGIKGSVQYLYSATGVKLQTIHKTDGAAQRTPMAGAVAFETEATEDKTTDYVSNKIYENGELVKILVDGGYYDVKEKKYYFYIQDHLGNNRVVADAEGTVVQKSDYYPFGMEFADNTYMFNPCCLSSSLPLYLYGCSLGSVYSARYMKPAIGRFTSVDPLAEKYYSISPYVYVGNNPIKRIDPDGKEFGDYYSYIGDDKYVYRESDQIPDGEIYVEYCDMEVIGEKTKDENRDYISYYGTVAMIVSPNIDASPVSVAYIMRGPDTGKTVTLTSASVGGGTGVLPSISAGVSISLVEYYGYSLDNFGVESLIGKSTGVGLSAG